MSQQIIGIDIGTYSLKVVQLERHLMDLKILQFIEQPLSSSTRQSHAEQVSVLLEQIFSTHSLKADVVSMCLPGNLLSSRILELPFTNIKKINQVLEFELEGYVPFALEDLFFDYSILDQTPTNSYILCAYLMQSHIDNYMQHLAKVNIHPKYLGADFADLSGIAQVAMVPAEGYYAICDIGHSKTNFCIMEGKKLKYTRTIGLGGLHFTRAVQRVFNLNYEKADALKTSRGKLFVREEESDQISRILSQVGVELVTAIKQTCLGFNNFYGFIPLNAIYCCGGGSKMVGILDYLSFHLRTNVLDLDCLGFTTHHLDDPENTMPVIPQALASALRPVFSNRMAKINFRKGPYTYKQDWEVIKSELTKSSYWLIVIFVLSLVYYFYADHYYTQKITVVDKKVQELIAKEFPDMTIRKGEGSKNIKNYLKAAKSKLGELKTQSSLVSGDALSILHIFELLSNKLPSKKEVRLDISDFTYKDGFISILARTNDRKNVSTIVDALKSDAFTSIESTEPQPKTKEEWEFTIKILLKDQESLAQD